MDRQSMQGGGGGGGGDGAVKEFCYGGGGGQPEVIDGAFLMELLEDTPAANQPPEGVDYRLSRVIRSLEAEIGGGTAPEPAAVGDAESTTDGPTSDDGGLEGMLSDFDSSPGPCWAEAPVPPALAPFEYWAEVPPAMGHDMGGWYVDGDSVVVGYEFREQCYYTYGEGSAVDQVYSPLWE